MLIGPIFVGDGCMGADEHGNIENLPLPWYLEVARSEQHFIIVDFAAHSHSYHLQGINIHGDIFDSFDKQL